MPKTLRNTLLSFRDLLVTGGPFIVLTIALLAVAYWVLDPNPPTKVVLATGTDQGAYAAFGERYAALLKPYGITVELRATQGSGENLRLLRDPKSGVDIAFVQGGSGERLRREANSVAGADDDDEAGLVSLGSLFYEPVWLFYRDAAAKELLKAPALTSLSQLPGWKVNIGARGSGSPNLMLKLIDANRIDPATLTLERKAQTPATMDLLAGDSDALVFASETAALMALMLL